MIGGRQQLDRRLAAGDDPLATRALARRASVLVSARNRRRLACRFERIVVEIERPAAGMTAAIPVNRREVLAARTDLLLLAAALRGAAHPNPRGVAGAELLLTDGAGPVFAPSPPGSLRRAVRRVTAALGGE
jgi:hypothetical protein